MRLNKIQFKRRMLQARKIVNKVTKITDTYYTVKSQRKNIPNTYNIKWLGVETGWTCDCYDYTHYLWHCKHIMAVVLYNKIH